MKKVILLLLSAITFAGGCDRYEKKSDEFPPDSGSSQSLRSSETPSIESLTGLLKNLRENLDSISLLRQVIYIKTKGNEEVSPAIVSEINIQIRRLNDIIKNNKIQIYAINKQLRLAMRKNNELSETLHGLNSQLAEKETELNVLKRELHNYNMAVINLETVIGFLSVENAILAETVNEEMDRLQTAYYIVGSLKELKREQIIDEKGGWLGLGKTHGLNNELGKEKFTKINYTQTITIPVNSKKVRILTTHASDSYQLDRQNGTIANIQVNDPEKFWSVSKYLVIVKE